MLLIGALVGLLAPPVVFGISPEMPAEAIKARFSPEGDAANASWATGSDAGIAVLRYTCKAERRCFTVPSAAAFRLVDGRLADATLVLDAVRAPEGVAAQQAATAQVAPLGPPAIRSTAAGRRTRYYLGKGWSVAWTIDGPDGRIVLAADRHAPVTRAEAVAAGAPEDGLAQIPGAARYAAGHKAITTRAFAQAAAHFEAVLADREAAALLKIPTRLVLAMVLAAEVKRRGRLDASAERMLTRATGLAPQLKSDLTALKASLKR